MSKGQFTQNYFVKWPEFSCWDVGFYAIFIMRPVPFTSTGFTNILYTKSDQLFFSHEHKYKTSTSPSPISTENICCTLPESTPRHCVLSPHFLNWSAQVDLHVQYVQIQCTFCRVCCSFWKYGLLSAAVSWPEIRWTTLAVLNVAFPMYVHVTWQI